MPPSSKAIQILEWESVLLFKPRNEYRAQNYNIHLTLIQNTSFQDLFKILSPPDIQNSLNL